MSKSYRNELPFQFHAPTGGITTIRNIVYGRAEGGVEDKEDAVIALTECVTEAMEKAFRIGLELGIARGKMFT